MSSTASSKRTVRKNAGGQRQDIGWEHGIEMDGNAKKVKCKYCEKIHWGGVYRLKHHLAGTSSNVEPCLQVPEEVRQQFTSLLQNKSEDSQKKKRALYYNVDDDDNDSQEVEEVQKEKKQKGGKSWGAMDKFVSKSTIRQTTMNEKFKKEERNDVCQQIARFFYTSAISFNCVKNPEFHLMVKKIGDYGRGLKPPSFHEIRVTFLKKEVQQTMKVVEEFKQQWKRTGCSIMSDGWSDRRKRSICNFLVNSPSGSIFLSSIDTSEISKTGQAVFEMLDDVVDKVGEENVIQVITDNASNYKSAGKMLMQKRKKLFWTPCAAHCIDLMLEDFEKKLISHRNTIKKARSIVSFIYSRTLLNAWMLDYTKGAELIRPAITRFATAYLTLQRLHEHRGELLSLFSSEKWKSSKFARTQKGKVIEKRVLDTRQFWPFVVVCLKAAIPLIKVLRLVDSDERLAMGFIYEAMDRAKEQIQKNFNNVKKSYEPLWQIIDERWKDQLHHPLHAAAYLLNPQFAYSPTIRTNADLKIGFYECLSKLVEDKDERLEIDTQMDNFKDARGLFGIENAVLTRNRKSPADWWESFGDQTPELKRFAIRILSLTCSSSGCERNWSAFEMVHSKRRNRLHQKKLNDLVFVMYNLKLKERHKNRRNNMDPIILEDCHSDDEWITEREDPVLPKKDNWLRVLDKDAQHNSDDEENEVEIITRTVERACDVENEVEEVQDISEDDLNEPLNASISSNVVETIDNDDNDNIDEEMDDNLELDDNFGDE